MYLHLGKDTVVRKKDIIGIFDLDTSTVSATTRNYLAKAEKDGKVINVSPELPKSFVLCKDGNGCKVYICQLSPVTLIKRATQF
ncbi:MAG: DUF370 domain-containing protein [Clostridia bacterium]|nr:DUF370 domain-containing protein [Clostridia bacterium]